MTTFTESCAHRYGTFECRGKKVTSVKEAQTEESNVYPSAGRSADSQESFAHRSGYHRNYVGQLERGEGSRAIANEIMRTSMWSLGWKEARGIEGTFSSDYLGF